MSFKSRRRVIISLWVYKYNNNKYYKQGTEERQRAEVPQLSRHDLAFKRLGGRTPAIFSTTFWMIFGDVGSAKPRCASSWATGLPHPSAAGKRADEDFEAGRCTPL